MSECLPCSRGDCDRCHHPTCTCDHEPTMIEFGVCPDGDDCAAPDCDGTDLGHTLAVEFPEETARVVKVLSPVEAWLRKELTLGLATAMGTPLSAVDGRPWVPTHEEEHPAFLWGNGTGADGTAGCGHADCEDGP